VLLRESEVGRIEGYGYLGHKDDLVLTVFLDKLLRCGAGVVKTNFWYFSNPFPLHIITRHIAP